MTIKKELSKQVKLPIKLPREQGNSLKDLPLFYHKDLTKEEKEKLIQAIDTGSLKLLNSLDIEERILLLNCMAIVQNERGKTTFPILCERMGLNYKSDKYKQEAFDKIENGLKKLAKRYCLELNSKVAKRNKTLFIEGVLIVYSYYFKNNQSKYECRIELTSPDITKLFQKAKNLSYIIFQVEVLNEIILLSKGMNNNNKEILYDSAIKILIDNHDRKGLNNYNLSIDNRLKELLLKEKKNKHGEKCKLILQQALSKAGFNITIDKYYNEFIITKEIENIKLDLI